MDPSNSAPTTAWPRLNETSSDSPIILEQPLTAVSLPTRNSIWVDEDVSTAYPQTARPREDLLASFFPSDSPPATARQAPIQSYPLAYPLAPGSKQALPVLEPTTQNDRRVSSKYSEYDDIPVPLSARFQRDLQEMIGSPSSIYPDSALPDPLHISRDFPPKASAYQGDRHPEPSRSPKSIRLSELTQSPVGEGTSELFPEYTEDIRPGESTHNIVPTINVLPQSPQQPDVQNSHSQKYQPQLLAPPRSSKPKSQRRTTRSSSIINGLDQGIYRPLSKPPQNRDLFYATQKDDSRFSRHHPSSKKYIHRKRASSLERTSVPTDPRVAKLWDERINAGHQPFTPSDTIPTYQEFRRTTQRVDSPSSDRFPLPASALSQYEDIPPHLRPTRESDFRFDPKLVQEIYEERWKISEGYENLQAYFSDPKEGPYKHLNIKEWVELFEYLEERDRKATEREIIFELRAI
ncbi:uncharacterized protein EAE97_004940 [Botrytis byssoidea]|uniref:Uncharacterized protein n=1 Tax=Botrytis byssoidea TaxID=139641 RepID=A0A9P5IQ71_9HELO|nr:uncharacterized protein EAE97_004940 [Botrytis byssoidea]KAF7945902.1 hypothetical protein EAE97_004940 [Botrytis byssoidea]